MIHFKTIRFKNFLAVGNQFIEISLDKSPTTLITGSNGAGKSTFLDALTFVLYNKPFRKINKSQLVNSINQKDCLVEIEFVIGSMQYLVRRGIKPNIFEIYEMPVTRKKFMERDLIDQNGTGGDYQAHLEKNILKMNYNAFTQIVILGKATYVPFMRLPAQARRDVVEDLLGLKIFSTMNKILKQKMADIKTRLSEVENNIGVLEEKIELHEEYLARLSEEKDDRIRKIQANIDELRAENEKDSGEIDSLQEQRKKLLFSTRDEKQLRNKLEKLKRLQVEFQSRISGLAKDIDFFEENEDCPTCKQPITAGFRQKQLSIHKQKHEKLTSGMDDLEKQLKELISRLDEIANVNKEIHDVDVQLSALQSAIGNRNKQISRLELQIQKIEKLNSGDINKKIKDLQTTLEDERKNRAEVMETSAYYSGIAVMLKDTGIKTLIIQKYLPVFNQYINQYLQSMGFFVSFNLDETFNEEILSRYRDKFSYASFSEGQKLRIDLAIMLTWREIAKLKNSLNTNLLIMDEVFDSSLDQDGVDAFMQIIPTMENVNIFVVSHTPDKLYDKFRSQIHFKLDGNFTVIDEE